MANISYGPLADKIRGSIGGVTFSRAASGETVRAKPRPPKPRSTSQVEKQAYLAAGSFMWKQLPGVLKTAWGVYAATITLYNSLGQAYSPTARQAFIWSMNIQEYLPGPAVGNAPGGVGLALIPTLTFDYNANDLRLTAWVPAPHVNDDFVFMIYYADEPHAFNRMPRKCLQVITGAQALPFILCADIDDGFTVGDELKTFVGIRVFDNLNRISTRRMQGFEFTVV